MRIEESPNRMQCGITTADAQRAIAILNRYDKNENIVELKGFLWGFGVFGVKEGENTCYGLIAPDGKIVLSPHPTGSLCDETGFSAQMAGYCFRSSVGKLQLMKMCFEFMTMRPNVTDFIHRRRVG